MIDRSKVWTGSLNRNALGGGDGSPVRLYDTTLRDGEQTVGVVLGPSEKLEIAQLVDALGVDRIEVGFPRVSDDYRTAIEMIVAAGLRAEVWGFARAVPADVDAVLELGLEASVIEAPISDLKARRARRLAGDDARRNRSAVATQPTRVSRWPSSASTGRAAISASSRRSIRPRSLPALPRSSSWTRSASRRRRLPRTWSRAYETRSAWTCPLHYHGHDDFGLATAGAVAAVRAGADWIHGTVNGMGERAGNANLPEIALVLEAIYGYTTSLRLEETVHVSARIAELSGYRLAPWTPLVGENLFRRETGAVAAQFHDPPAVEPYASELVGAERGIVLGKKSGADSIRIKAEDARAGRARRTPGRPCSRR